MSEITLLREQHAALKLKVSYWDKRYRDLAEIFVKRSWIQRLFDKVLRVF